MINRGICHFAHTVVLSKALSNLAVLSVYTFKAPVAAIDPLSQRGQAPFDARGQGVVPGIGRDRSERTGGTVQTFRPAFVEYTVR